MILRSAPSGSPLPLDLLYVRFNQIVSFHDTGCLTTSWEIVREKSYAPPPQLFPFISYADRDGVSLGTSCPPRDPFVLALLERDPSSYFLSTSEERDDEQELLIVFQFVPFFTEQRYKKRKSLYPSQSTTHADPMSTSDPIPSCLVSLTHTATRNIY